jgi:hypothetical protein
MKLLLWCRSSRSAPPPQSLPWWPALVLWPGLCGPALALELFEGFQVHGFLTQGYFLTSDHNNLFGESTDGGSLDFTEIGVNASWVPRPDVQLAIQGLSRRAGGASEGEPELDFALLDYAAVESADRRLGVRAGRVRLPFGFYNDTRDVAFTRPSILLPQSIYFDRTRELTISGDGILFYAEERGAWGNFMLEFLGPFFQRIATENSELSLFGFELPGDLESRVSFLGRLIYETPVRGLRLAITGGRGLAKYNPRFDPSQDLGPGDDTLEPLIFSAQYEAEHWSLTGEYARRRIKDEGFSSAAFPNVDQDTVGESYYVQGIYRIDPHWEMVLRYDVFFGDVDDRDGSEFEARTGFPSHLQFAKDWTVGVRYNITPSLMARAEYHNVYGGTLYLLPQDNPDPFALNKKWDIFALLLSYRF